MHQISQKGLKLNSLNTCQRLVPPGACTVMELFTIFPANFQPPLLRTAQTCRGCHQTLLQGKLNSTNYIRSPVNFRKSKSTACNTERYRDYKRNRPWIVTLMLSVIVAVGVVSSCVGRAVKTIIFFCCRISWVGGRSTVCCCAAC